jgi:L-iditol 2-dehydrogenase
VAGAGEILAADPLPHRRMMAEKLGSAKVGSSVAEIVEWSSGGCTLVVEATNSPDGFSEAVTAARIGGRIVLVGIPDGDRYHLSAADARRRGLKIKFARRMGEVYRRAIALVETGKVDVVSMVSHRIGLSETPGVFQALADSAPGYNKVLIYPNGS